MHCIHKTSTVYNTFCNAGVTVSSRGSFTTIISTSSQSYLKKAMPNFHKFTKNKRYNITRTNFTYTAIINM